MLDLDQEQQVSLVEGESGTGGPDDEGEKAKYLDLAQQLDEIMAAVQKPELLASPEQSVEEKIANAREKVRSSKEAYDNFKLKLQVEKTDRSSMELKRDRKIIELNKAFEDLKAQNKAEISRLQNQLSESRRKKESSDRSFQDSVNQKIQAMSAVRGERSISEIEQMRKQNLPKNKLLLMEYGNAEAACAALQTEWDKKAMEASAQIEMTENLIIQQELGIERAKISRDRLISGVQDAALLEIRVNLDEEIRLHQIYSDAFIALSDLKKTK